jgi:hypothetical protein
LIAARVADILRGVSAAYDDVSVLRNALSVGNLGAIEASIPRISVKPTSTNMDAFRAVFDCEMLGAR